MSLQAVDIRITELTSSITMINEWYKLNSRFILVSDAQANHYYAMALVIVTLDIHLSRHSVLLSVRKWDPVFIVRQTKEGK